MPGNVTANPAPAPPKRFRRREGAKYQKESSSMCVQGASFFVKRSGAIPRIPKGFRLKAQSCPDPSGLLWDSVHQKPSTPKGLRLLAPDGRARTSHNPVGVVLFVALLTHGSPDGSGQPWAGRRNRFGVEQNGCSKHEMRPAAPLQLL